MISKYSTLIQWSEEDQVFVASVPELEGLSAFGETPEGAVKELSVAKRRYLEALKRDTEVIPEPDVLKPFSGQTRIRISKFREENGELLWKHSHYLFPPHTTA